MKPRIVIWGLKSVRHTHRFIHASFHENFQRLGYSVLWIDDETNSRNLIQGGDVIFCADVARRFIPSRKDVKYVLHNISPTDLGIENNYIRLQVFSHDASGNFAPRPWIKWNEKERILFQPWGVPTPKSEWLSAGNTCGLNEYWVGSIWNNIQNQGNELVINQFQSALKTFNISFKQIGSPKLFSPNGISEKAASKKVNISPIGAAVVGEWQNANGYIPCRLFKNIASGSIPVSNSNFSAVFGTAGGIFESNLDLLVERVLSVGTRDKKEIVISAQEAMLPYTYESGIARILEFLYS